MKVRRLLPNQAPENRPAMRRWHIVYTFTFGNDPKVHRFDGVVRGTTPERMLAEIKHIVLPYGAEIQTFKATNVEN